jgi:hypothetical protein
MLCAMVTDNNGWSGLNWNDWSDLERVRARLAAGADPNSGTRHFARPLHVAAQYGTADVVAELAGRVDDVDAEYSGRTALWSAVYANRPDNARALVEAGADPWRPMMAGWSPGRLSLAGPTPDLFGSTVSLSPAEAAAAEEGHRLNAVLAGLDIDGLSLACVTDIDVAEAQRRLAADITGNTAEDIAALQEEAWSDPLADRVVLTMWATDVPGGCVIAQPWVYGASMPGVTKLLSAETTCYAMYANPKSGNQGSITVNGHVKGWDLSPGGAPDEHDSPQEVLASYLYQHNAIAYCCAYARLRLTDARAIKGPPDVWLRLPNEDYWH